MRNCAAAETVQLAQSAPTRDRFQLAYMTDINVYSRRRAALLAQMQSGIAIVPTAPQRARNRDSEYLYRFDSYFYYLCGFREP